MYLYMYKYTRFQQFSQSQRFERPALNFSGGQLFRTHCSKHVSPAAILRTIRSKRFEEVNRLRTARSKRCVATQRFERAVRNLFASSKRFERVVRNIGAGQTCCEQVVLNSCKPRTFKNKAFETSRLGKCLAQCICVHI